MAAGDRMSIGVELKLRVGGNLLPLGATSSFTGNLVAQDSVTGDKASLPVTVTITVPPATLIQIDSRCLQVELHIPGGPASLAPGVFSLDGQASTSQPDIVSLGGPQTEFPVFEWASYADGCPGFPDQWHPEYALSVYPVYPAQSPEEAVQNEPIWRAVSISNTSIQYPPTAEPLSGLYVWQVVALPVLQDKPGVKIENLNQVGSDIWMFYVGEPSPVKHRA
jgi:hypothetical protein